MFIRFLAPGVRRGLLAAMLFALPLLVSAPAAAQTAAERAAQLNDEGKKLWLEEDDLPGAVKKFRQATMLSPEGRYYFNLCYALHQLGRYREALTACEAVEPNSDDDKLIEKTNVVLEDLRKRLPPEPDPDTTTDPDQDAGTGGDQDTGYDQGTGTGTGGDQDTGGDYGYQDGDGDQGYDNAPPPGPLPGLQQPAGPKDDYKWAIGGELGFLFNGLGQDGFYGRGGAVLKLHASFMWLSEQRIGVQPYLHISQIGADDEFGATGSLEIIDIGGAIFKHIPFRSMYLTPLVGAHVSGLQPGASTFDLAEPVVKVGLRAETGIAWVLGKDRNHVISVTPALNVYSATTGDSAINAGLRDGGITLSVTAGYTMRFTTPFGRVPLITLE